MVGESEDGELVFADFQAQTLHVAFHAVEVGFEGSDANVSTVRFLAAARKQSKSGDPNHKNPKTTHPRIHNDCGVGNMFAEESQRR